MTGEKLFKTETYLISALNADGSLPQGEAGNGYHVTECFRRACLTKGFSISVLGGYEAVGEFLPDENVSFAKVEEALNITGNAGKLALFVSNKKDIMGENLLTNPKRQRAKAFISCGLAPGSPMDNLRE